MTQPTENKPASKGTSINVSWRGVVSILETAAFVAAAVQGSMDNGQDLRHAIITAFIGFVAHGVNHNLGGSPV